MDLRSLNGGTVEEKEWLNPVVGTLTSQTSYAGQYLLKDPVSGFPVRQCGAAFAYQSGIPIPIYDLTSGTYTDVTTQQVTGNYIPTSQLQVNNTFEIYMAGTFLEENYPLAGALQLYPAFVPPSTIADAMTEINIPFDSVLGAKSFEFRCIFRVIAFTDSTITCQVSYQGTAYGTASSKVNAVTDTSIVPIPTASRESNTIFPLRVYATGAFETFRRYQYYIRQIS
jgi:hypothetical protein